MTVTKRKTKAKAKTQAKGKTKAKSGSGPTRGHRTKPSRTTTGTQAAATNPSRNQPSGTVADDELDNHYALDDLDDSIDDHPEDFPDPSD